VAVLAGLATRWAFGTGVALQYRQVQLAPAAGRGPMRLLAHVARQRRWLAGMALPVAAHGLPGLALTFGPLTLVAPMTATDLLLALATDVVYGLAAALTLNVTRLLRQHRAGQTPGTLAAV